MNITVRELLEEAKKNLPEFKVGQFLETLKPIYPISESRAERNIKINGKEVTKPLAVDKKTKREFIKHNSPFRDFFRNKTKGDILEIVEIDGNTAKCVNLSINEEIKERFYKNKYVFVCYEDIITGVVKTVKRNIDKYIKE